MCCFAIFMTIPDAEEYSVEFLIVSFSVDTTSGIRILNDSLLPKIFCVISIFSSLQVQL